MTDNAAAPWREGQKPVYPELTRAQWELLTAMTDQRCVNMTEAMDFVSDLPEETREFLKKAKPKTLEWLQDLRDEEVVGLQAYLRLRSTSSYLAWAIGGAIGGVIAISAFWNAIAPFLGKGPK